MPQISYFAYLGPNRRSDLRLVEARLDFTTQETSSGGLENLVAQMSNSLVAGGVLAPGDMFPSEPLAQDYMRGYASLLAQTVLLFQRKAGHRVGYHQLMHEPKRHRYIALVEHEHGDVGMTAMKLAIELITGKRTLLQEPFTRFCEFAKARILPLETEAIIAAAGKQGVPCFQLERYPLQHKPGGPGRLRNNGLLKLGHGARSRLLEGTFLPREASDAAKTWLQSPEDRRRLLQSLGVCPVAEPRAGANKYHVVVVGGRVFAVEDLGQGQIRPVASVDKSLAELALQVYTRAGNQPVSLALSGEGLDHALGGESIEVLDFQLAPDLGAFFSATNGHDPGMLDEVANRLVEDLFPTAEQARIPTVAITGTNGKTTTSRMVSHILQHAGLKPGLVCTSGVFIDGEMLMDTDAGTILGHARLLVRDDIESAVLETHHRGIFMRGFAFHDCDIAVCLNVTEDHLDHGNIESVDELVELKSALIRRARQAAILYADNPGSCGMRGQVKADKLWLVSLESGVAALREMAGSHEAGCAVLETIKGQEWLVLYDREERIPLIQSGRIPATFSGAARFNVSNAMHAAVAALEVGVPVELIRSALARFQAGREQTLGRLNVYDRLPFRVIVDNAHNPDGLGQLMKFVDRQSTPGRKVLSFAAPRGRRETVYRHMAQAVAGHFDVYFCNDHTHKDDVKPARFAPILRDELLACGIEQEKVLLAKRGREAWGKVFGACEPGDLLILLLSSVDFEDAHRFIEGYE